MSPTAHDFEVVLIVASGLGVLGACVSALGTSRIYERVGRGYLDVADADPVVQSADEPLEVTEVREMREATDALRRARGDRSRAGQERIDKLLRELARE